MRRTDLIRFAAGLALLGLAMSAVALLPPSENPTLLSEAVFDAGHVPMFMLFALLVLVLASTCALLSDRHDSGQAQSPPRLAMLPQEEQRADLC